ncbi:hypothetical protein FNO01nite_08490 [Flavobacterium noncentrifugens]|uniref:Por secretion system C-terminal sorting domain-containing protein n=1 Tax=Flavobacterium noncentrifugens TaxID=1128970 RepID=A0A1G8TCN0_9FLAO|nr:T9SS type A sorting domain-containing protein [Flavobacterium noncentrifugens]GEP50177.1 hypothetical protein FNO01nite_08490 [Flavobacterium noncentrifugens]SDJ39362.1 Por secretion system C-terminal sorting domain-containing protein [Flavobacterium noncentrifugens]
MIKKFFLGIAFFAIQNIPAQIQPLGLGGVSQAGPVDPVLDYNAIKFDYDTAGNQIKRYMIYLADGQGKHLSGEDSSEISNNLVQDQENFQISYYPNPVRSELYVKWIENTNEDLQKMYLYDLNGKQMNYFPNLTSEDNIIIDFQQYPSGIYNLLLYYSSGKTKTLKIVRP